MHNIASNFGDAYFRRECTEHTQTTHKTILGIQAAIEKLMLFTFGSRFPGKGKYKCTHAHKHTPIRAHEHQTNAHGGEVLEGWVEGQWHKGRHSSATYIIYKCYPCFNKCDWMRPHACMRYFLADAHKHQTYTHTHTHMHAHAPPHTQRCYHLSDRTLLSTAASGLNKLELWMRRVHAQTTAHPPNRASTPHHPRCPGAMKVEGIVCCQCGLTHTHSPTRCVLCTC